LVAVPSRGRASLVEAPQVAPEAALTHGLYERHAAKILSYCQHQLGSREEAEDAVQTTFMNAFRALGRGIVPETETAWLFKIAENVCLSRRRSSWRRGRIESPSDFEVIEEVVPGPSRQRDELIGIEDALASMPEQQRRAILLREWQGLSYREIAEELELSQSAVETLIFRARRSLAQGLEQPDRSKPARRKGLRRALHAVDLGTVIATLKTLLTSAAAAKATVAAVAVTAAAGAAVSVSPKHPHAQPVKAPPAHVQAAAPAVAGPVSVATRAVPTASAESAVQSAPVAVPKGRTAVRDVRPAASSRGHADAAPLERAAPISVPPPPAPVAVEPAPVAVAELPVVAAAPEQPAAESTPVRATEHPQVPAPKAETRQPEIFVPLPPTEVGGTTRGISREHERDQPAPFPTQPGLPVSPGVEQPQSPQAGVERDASGRQQALQGSLPASLPAAPVAAAPAPPAPVAPVAPIAVQPAQPVVEPASAEPSPRRR
jgi:RNA polymerase sigma factor (sigma-70 family)